MTAASFDSGRSTHYKRPMAASKKAKTAAKASPKGPAAISAAIAMDISSGLLGNGAWLKQIDIETRYGCTRADARRALEALAIKGSVQRIPQRGYYVTVIDEASRRELVAVRVLLETAMVPSIVERATGKDIRDLRRLAAKFAAAARDGDVAEKYRTNRAFHVRLADICGNRELAKLALAVRGDLPTTPIVQWRSQARIERSCQEHSLIVEALAKRDVRRLTKLISVHIRQPESKKLR
jgi:DNA-binding GntR family transcriptional regulator